MVGFVVLCGVYSGKPRPTTRFSYPGCSLWIRVTERSRTILDYFVMVCRRDYFTGEVFLFPLVKHFFKRCL